jgi:DNA polymerase III subunit gamma/tau
MSFYRTYRPQVIDQIDNVSVRETLLSFLTKEPTSLPHAFLFSGPRGAGKTTAARVIAKLFNCEKPSKKHGPCGACEQCVSIAEGRNLDVLELDAASNRGIDEIRTLREGIGLSPVAAKFKVYIIDEVHMLTTEAFNALLKTLEEPPPHAVFVLATTDPQKVPVTIISRCMQCVFARATPEEINHALSRIVKKEKIAIDADALAVLSRSVDGSFRDAVKLLEQASFHKETITVDALEQVLSLTTATSVLQFLDAVQKKRVKEALQCITALVHRGTDMKVFMTQCLQQLQQILLSLAAKETTEQSWDEGELRVCIRKLSQAYTELRTTPIAQLPLELAVVEYCSSELSTRPEPAFQQAGSLHPVMEGKVTSTAKAAVSPGTAVSSLPSKDEEKLSDDGNTKSSGMLTVEKLADHWVDVIAEMKPVNHAVAGVMRSTRPTRVKDGIVTIEAFYTFHKDKLSEMQTRETISGVLKKLFGEKVKVEVVLGKK